MTITAAMEKSVADFCMLFYLYTNCIPSKVSLSEKKLDNSEVPQKVNHVVCFSNDPVYKINDTHPENKEKSRNIKKYLLAALFNAPSTMDAFYQTEVNHDQAYGACEV